MCGIALLVGPGAREHAATFAAMLETVRPRGEVEEPLLDDDALLGTHRLRIVDRDRAVQPWLSADGRWVLCYNGEVFNHRELRERAAWRGSRAAVGQRHRGGARGRSWRGARPALRLRGEFAFASSTRLPAASTWPATRSGSSRSTGRASTAGCTVASEVKALVGRSARPCHRGAARSPRLGRARHGAPQLHPYVDLLRLARASRWSPTSTRRWTSSGGPTARRCGCGSTPTSPSASSCPAGWTARWRCSRAARCTRTASRSPSAPRAARTSRTPVASPPTSGCRTR